ncbi:MAG: NmrA family NAD(P)-binding protein [Chloracidobacterium sp.]|nr:NmrA family NAD(P)-binding protein [Chloracidobacterium sp.]
MPNLITITGATGHVGGGIAERLLDSGHKVRAIARSEERLKPLAEKGAEIWAGDLADTEFLTKAFEGADAVFAMIPPNPAAEDLRADYRKFADSIARSLQAAGTKNVVALSSVGGSLPSGTGPIAGLHEFEERLKQVAGLSLTVLRPTYFMENFLYTIPLIKSAGINGGAIKGDVPVAMIATADIAEAAAGILAGPGSSGTEVRELLGPKDLTFSEASGILGAAIGKPDLQYVEFSDQDYRGALLGMGFSPSVADSYLEMDAAISNGIIQNTTTRDAESTTKTTLDEFARDVFAPAFKGAAAEAKA